MKNDCLDAALNELDNVGIRDVTRSYGGRGSLLPCFSFNALKLLGARRCTLGSRKRPTFLQRRYRDANRK